MCPRCGWLLEPDLHAFCAFLQEMWLLKREPSPLPSAGVEDSYHVEGPFESSAVPDMPAWPGSWKVDLVARLTDAAGRSFWVKALRRDMTAYDGT